MKELRLILVFMTLVIPALYGQQATRLMTGDGGEGSLRLDSAPGMQGFRAIHHTGSLSLKLRSTPEGKFRQLKVEGLVPAGPKGNPELPVRSRLIQVPADAGVRVTVHGFDEQIISLNQQGIPQKIFPVQPSKVKHSEGNPEKFYFSREIYKADRFIGQDLVSINMLGFMRDLKLARLQVAPVQYNPARNQLRVISNLEFEVRFTGQGDAKGKKPAHHLNSYFKPLQGQLLNAKNLSLQTDSSNEPVSYVVVAPPAYRQVLQPFIKWKQTRGFHVVEAYTDSIGQSRQEIYQFLKTTYRDPEVTPHTFVLLVGDVEQIPAWEGSTGSHVTDFHYGEYTDDWLPEAYCGRFPARDTASLRHMIDKTIRYEKFQFDNPGYLEEALLVAGDDDSYEDTYANGQINYATEYYFNAGNGFRAHAFLQDPPQGNSAIHDSIMYHMNKGVGFATYTAHCSSNGWNLPRFSTSDLEGVEANGRYGLWISNCCGTMHFEQDNCFGEAAFRSEQKGAIGSIGASGDTYWDEDYWWSVGVTSSIQAHPTYQESGLGLYDRLFHTHGEPPGQWYISQGELMAAGNLAVEASASDRNDYYWEVYNLMGDPSLMPYMGAPEPLDVDPPDTVLRVGADSLTLDTEPYATVALSREGNLLGVDQTGEQGRAHLTFPPLTRPGQVTLVVTAQNREPWIRNMDVAPTNEPYVVTDTVMLADSSGNSNGMPDYGESIRLGMVLHNLSDSMSAQAVHASLLTRDPYVEMKDDTACYGTIPPRGKVNRQAAFALRVNDSVPDQHQVLYRVAIKGQDNRDSTYAWSSTRRLNLQAPVLTFAEDLMVEDSAGGNGLLDPGEQGSLSFILRNKGHAALENFTCRLDTPEDNPDLVLLDSLCTGARLPANTTDTLSFRVAASDSASPGTPVRVKVTAAGAKNTHYHTSRRSQFVIGQTPAYRIDQTDTVKTCYARFYDSGGPDHPYSNQETHSLTFLPQWENCLLKTAFESFEVENDYDWMKVYDGPAKAENLTGTYDGSNPPGELVSSGPGRSMTFKFASDYTVTQAGWNALVTCLESYPVHFRVDTTQVAPQKVRVAFNGDTLRPDSSGLASFIAPRGDYRYKVWARGFHPQKGRLHVESETLREISLSPIYYNLTFRLQEKGGDTLVEGTVALDDSTLHTSRGVCTFRQVSAAEEHVYRVQAPGYDDVTGRIRAEADTTVHVDMGSLLYDVTVRVLDDDSLGLGNALLQVGNASSYTDSTGKAEFSLPHGRHLLRASKPGYTSTRTELMLNDDMFLNVSLMKLFRVLFNIKGIDYEGLPTATVKIDTFELQADPAGQAVVKLPQGHYPYLVMAEGYKDHSSRVEVNEDKRVQVLLARMPTALNSQLHPGILIYPNPTDGTLHIENATDERFLGVTLTAVNGKVLERRKSAPPHVKFDLSRYSPGVYLIRVETPQAAVTRKIILK